MSGLRDSELVKHRALVVAVIVRVGAVSVCTSHMRPAAATLLDHLCNRLSWAHHVLAKRHDAAAASVAGPSSCRRGAGS